MPSAQSGIARRIEIKVMGLSGGRGLWVCEQRTLKGLDGNFKGFWGVKLDGEGNDDDDDSDNDEDERV